MPDLGPAELLAELVELPDESEWVEFKLNNSDPQMIGQNIAALANSAALLQRDRAFIVWGVKDRTHEIRGTTFKPRKKKVGNQQLENWLSTQLEPRVHFRIHEFQVGDKDCVLFEVEPARHRPISFKRTEWIRIGSYTKPLLSHPDKERLLWKLFSRESFESGIALPASEGATVLQRLRYWDYFSLLKRSIPESPVAILEALEADQLIRPSNNGTSYEITNLGAILFASDLNDFPDLRRKAARVIFYKNSSRVETLVEHEGRYGYASGFSGLIRYFRDRLPQSEEISEALRTEAAVYPEIAIRELVANALIHQDFDAIGTGPMVEVFDGRIEITNPGTPLIDIDRFLDLPPRSRNDSLARLMRHLGICEERGSGIDKVLTAAEIYQLPPPDFQVTGESTRVVLFAPRSFREMSRAERIRASYQHAGLLYLQGKQLTNATLRKRLRIKDRGTASRVIADTLEENLIKPHDPTSSSRRYASYVPFWA